MVGIVIVAHSRKLAEGVKELAGQMVQGRVPIAVAGGIEDPEQPFGTDAMKVLQAIEAVWHEAGVLVLMDLGSALLSAEMALDFLPEEKRKRVRMVAAPLVEGAVAAAVRADTGGTLDQVAAEALGALKAKAAQLGEEMEGEAEVAPPAPMGQGREVQMVIRNRLGLHARPAARFVNTASRFHSRILVWNLTTGKGPVDARSINQIATLGVRQGHKIRVQAQGPDAEEALKALQDLVRANFEELEETESGAEILESSVPVWTEEGEVQGIPVSPGIALGPAYVHRPRPPEVPERRAENPREEWNRLSEAITRVKERLARIRQRALFQTGEYQAAIFEAHRLFLEDPALLEHARRLILEEGWSAETAWKRATDAMIEEYRKLDDPYLQERAQDLVDVRDQVLRFLLGEAAEPIRLPHPAILVASDLTPSETLHLDPSRVLGLCLAFGGPTSHSAILARSMGIPAVAGLGERILQVREGERLALDGERGRVWINPPEEIWTELEARRGAWEERRRKRREEGRAPAVTRDGYRIKVVANIQGIPDARRALEFGAEGIGLFRTELLFIDRETPPSEEEQAEIYRAVAELMGTRPLVIRTLDVGGDKPVSYLTMKGEPNPFLGLRGIRLTLRHREIFKTQLRAILRASPGHNIKIMFPMISSLKEVREARAILEEAQSELKQRKIPIADKIEVGIMVETPAAALLAESLAREVDFFSIGTNDLSQYTMAADRTHEEVSSLADPFHPALLRLIWQTVKAAHQEGRWVGLCGEFAADPLAVPLLLGLGVDELSASPPAIPVVKSVVRRVTLAQARAVAQNALTLSSPSAVRDLVASAIPELPKIFSPPR